MCRELSHDLSLPTMMRRGKFVMSVGTDGTVFFYEFDGWVTYRAQFDVDQDGTISWVDNDIVKSPAIVAQIIDTCFALTFLRYREPGENAFRHWCSIDCWLEHDTLPHD